jgi:hypothetical protein
MDCAKNVTQVGVGSVMHSLATIAKSSQPARLLFGDKFPPLARASLVE